MADGLARVRETIAGAAERSGRRPDEVMLVAVSKEVTPDRVGEAIRAGQRDFGENRAQEGLSKHLALEGEPVTWHFIGRLQRNKVARVVRFAQFVHSIDRIELAREIERRASAPVSALIEVNLTGEEAKAGVAERDLISLVEMTLSLTRVHTVGLMTMTPLGLPEDSRLYFRRLGKLFDRLSMRFPDGGIRHLSMGMSQDYAVAVEEGATMVRVGRAIFGERPSEGSERGPQDARFSASGEGR